MAVRYYDEALLNKIKSWVKDPNMQVLSVNDSTMLFRNRADIKNDKPLQLPIISLSRDSDIEVEYPHKKPMSFDGMMLRSKTIINDEQEKEILSDPIKYKDVTIKEVTDKELNKVKEASISLNAIPIHLKYQLDIYTRYIDEGDEYLRNFVFNLVNHPKLQVTLPYNDMNFIHNANVMIESTVSDNSDIEQHLFPDQFTRWTIRLDIDDAYLFSIPISQNINGVIDIEID